MRGFLLLLRRDLVQRAPLFMASLAMGLCIVCLPFLLGSRLSPTELRGAAGLITALAWCTVLALFQGGSILTRDLTENRLAFDFRLPVRPSAIWAARLLTAIVTIALAAGLVLGPSAVAGMDWAGAAGGLDELLGHGVRGAIAYMPLAILALLFLANPIALAARTRSSWAAVDLISVGLASLAVYWTLGILSMWGAEQAIQWSCVAVASLCSVGTLIATAMQVSRGRSESDKARRALSLGILSTAFAIACALSGFATLILRPTARQLEEDSIYVRGLGPDWVELSGHTRMARDVTFRFLVNPNLHRELRLGPHFGRLIGGEVKLSFDGSTMAWLEADSLDAATSRLYTLSTVSQLATPLARPVILPASLGSWALSPDAKRLATTEHTGRVQKPQRLVVSFIESGAVETSIMLPGCIYLAATFFENNHALVVPCSPVDGDLRLAESVFRFDVRTHELSPLAFRPRSPSSFESAFRLFRGRSSWLRFEQMEATAPSMGWKLIDTEESAATIPIVLPESVFRNGLPPIGRQLHDGRFALTAQTSAGNLLLIFTDNGTLDRTIPIPEGESTTIIEELFHESSLLIATREAHLRSWDERWKIHLLDLSSGQLASLGSGMILENSRDVAASRSVMKDKDGRFLWFNPQSKVLQPVR